MEIFPWGFPNLCLEDTTGNLKKKTKKDLGAWPHEEEDG